MAFVTYKKIIQFIFFLSGWLGAVAWLSCLSLSEIQNQMACIPCADALLHCWKAEYLSCFATVLNAKEYVTSWAHPMRHCLPLAQLLCIMPLCFWPA
jgi:hypothetical protein